MLLINDRFEMNTRDKCLQNVSTVSTKPMCNATKPLLSKRNTEHVQTPIDKLHPDHETKAPLYMLDPIGCRSNIEHWPAKHSS